MPDPNPLEKIIEKRVCDYARSLGVLCYKFTSPSQRSVPDRLFIMPGGRGCFFIEFKRLGQKPTPAQEVEIAKIRRQGTAVFVVDNVHTGKEIIERLSKMPEPYVSVGVTMLDPDRWAARTMRDSDPLNGY